MNPFVNQDVDETDGFIPSQPYQILPAVPV